MRFLQNLLRLIYLPQFYIPFSWILAIHFFELVMLPSLTAQVTQLANIPLTERFLNIWFANSDGAYYFEIAKTAYSQTSPVFFPGWPLLSKLIGPTLTGTKLLSLAFTLGFFLLIPKVIKSLKIKVNVEMAIFTLIAFPASFVLTVPMSEPLFLFLIALTIIHVENKNYKTAAILAAISSATRPIGFVLAIYLVFRIAHKGSANLLKNWWVVLISVSGLLFYSLYLQTTLGDFAVFYNEQRHWNNSLSFESVNRLVNEQKDIVAQIFSPYKPIPLKIYQLVSIIFFFFLAILSFKKLNIGLWLFCFLIVFIPMLSGTYAGTSRYLLASFPYFIVLSQFFQKNKLIYYFYIFTSLLFQSYLLIRFFNFEAT